MRAATGFMVNQTPNDPLRDRLTGVALALTDTCKTPEIGTQVMAAVDREFQVLVAAFDAEGLGAAVPDWEADKKLLTMYSGRIQKRATKAP